MGKWTPPWPSSRHGYLVQLSMRAIMVLTVCTILVNTAKSQYSKQLETDRPGESKSAFVQSFRSFQAEIGFRKTKQGSEQYIFRHPAFTLRYGLTNWLEARADGELRTEVQQDHKESGLHPVRV